MRIEITMKDKTNNQWVKIEQDVHDDDDFDSLVSSIYENLNFLVAKRKIKMEEAQ